MKTANITETRLPMNPSWTVRLACELMGTPEHICENMRSAAFCERSYRPHEVTGFALVRIADALEIARVRVTLKMAAGTYTFLSVENVIVLITARPCGHSTGRRWV